MAGRVQRGHGVRWRAAILVAVVALGTVAGGTVHQPTARADDPTTSPASTSRLMTVYDRGQTSAFMTDAHTVSEALTTFGVNLDPHDTVEPSRDEELVAPEYKVNIYRARPVVVVDGNARTKIMTPYQTAGRIATDAGVPLLSEDIAAIHRSDDLIGDGAGLVLEITRATPFILDVYGRRSEARAQGPTVADMLRQKGVTLGPQDRTSVPLATRLTAGLEVRVWREGVQTTYEDQPVGFPVEYIYDADRPLGYKAVKVTGVPGVRTLTYQIDIREGREVSRKKIADMVTKAPLAQVTVLGIKGMGEGLTKAKGALFFTDSKGVRHRETYYDLDMGRVMQSCGQGGIYSVRVDGVKIDADGYVIIAANYGRYPKCSVVETSVGPGKVYDTGGFAAVHPDGFDIATDWSNNNGR